MKDPCQSSTCDYNPTAVCQTDYCGGCNARWYCGESDITMSCSSSGISSWICPTLQPETTTATATTPPTTITIEPITTEEEDEECPGLDLAITYLYIFEYNKVQKACDICLYEKGGKRSQRRCERIESFIDGVMDYYGECLLNVCDYSCTFGELVAVDQNDASEICGCETFICPLASNANNNNIIIMVISPFILIIYLIS